MQRNRWGLNRSIIIRFISRLCVCCVAFQRCRHIYRNNARLSTLLSQLAVAIIMTTRNYAIIDLIGVFCETVSSLLLRTTSSVSRKTRLVSEAGYRNTARQNLNSKSQLIKQWIYLGQYRKYRRQSLILAAPHRYFGCNDQRHL